ncbi:hypothetical protein LINPERPRIM_LOCUS18721 [Linum perenne]
MCSMTSSAADLTMSPTWLLRRSRPVRSMKANGANPEPSSAGITSMVFILQQSF